MMRDSRDSTSKHQPRSGKRRLRQASACASRRAVAPPALLPGVCPRERAALTKEFCGLHPLAGVIGRRWAAGAADDLLYADMLREVRAEATRFPMIDHIAWRLMDVLTLNPDQEPQREAIARDLAVRWADREPEAVAAVREALGPEADFEEVRARSVVAHLDHHGKLQSAIGSTQRCIADGLHLMDDVSVPAAPPTAPGDPVPDVQAKGPQAPAPIAPPSSARSASVRRTPQPVQPPPPARPPQPGRGPRPAVLIGARQGGGPTAALASEASCARSSSSSAPDAAPAARRERAPDPPHLGPALSGPRQSNRPDQPGLSDAPGRRPRPEPRPAEAKSQTPQPAGAAGARPSPGEPAPGPADAAVPAPPAPAAAAPPRSSAAAPAAAERRQSGTALWIQRLSQPARPAPWRPRRRATFD